MTAAKQWCKRGHTPERDSSGNCRRCRNLVQQAKRRAARTPNTTLIPLAPRPYDGTEACSDPAIDLAIFFPYYSDTASDAVEVCERCPLRQPCLDYALGHASDGIWGGTTEEERQRLRRAAGLPSRVVVGFMSRDDDRAAS